MTDAIFLPDIVIIFALAIVVILICDRLRLPTIVGFLVTGILSGPQGLKLIDNMKEVHQLAEIGVVLLLFKIGMKLSVSKIAQFKRFFFLGGPLQVVLTICAGFGVAQLLHRPIGESIFLGCLLSLSSTAIVLKIMEDRGESSTPQAKVMLGILIFQDIAAVLMMLATPHFARIDIHQFDLSFIWPITKGLLVLMIAFFSATRIVPRLLYYIARSQHRELFLLTILSICFGVAWLASSVGLSLALGAFLAGLIIAESEYSTEAIGGIIPSQEVFTSFFFVSIGMLFNVTFFLEHPFETFAVTIGVLILKFGLISLVTIFLGMPMRVAILAGMGLSQIGEFSFVLMRFGIDAGLGSAYHYQLFLAVSVITMALTPLLIFVSPFVAQWMLRLPLPVRLKAGFSPLKTQKAPEAKRDHVIIVGFGFNGRHLAHAAKEANIPYVILEVSADIVREEKKKGEPILFGDATHDTVLNHVNIGDARVLAIVVNDPIASRRIAMHARQINPSIDIITRTRYVSQMPQMYRAGANVVVPDEFGASVEIFSHVLQKYDVPSEQIEKSINEIREEGFQVVRHLFYKEKQKEEVHLKIADALVTTLHINTHSPLVGKTLEQSDLKNKYGIKVMLIGREEEHLMPVESKTRFLAHDVLVVIGSKDGLAHAAEEIQTATKSDAK